MPRILALILALLLPGAALAQATPLANPRDAAAAFVAAVAARDAAAIAAMYSEQSILLSPNEPPVQGRDAIRAAWERNFASGYSAIRFADNQRTDRGTDRAAHLYIWEATITPASGAPVTVLGRSMLYLVSVDGGWLISADIWQPIR